MSDQIELQYSEMLECSAHPKLYMSIAREMRDADNETGSVDLLYEAVANYPEDFLLKFQLGKSLHFLDRHIESQNILQQAHELKPTDIKVNELLAKVQRRVAQAQSRNFHRNQKLVMRDSVIVRGK